MLARRSQFHQDRLVEGMNNLSRPFVNMRTQLTHQFQTAGYDPVTAGRMALDQISQMMHQQAESLAYLDLFWLFSMAALFAAPLAFLMRRSVAEKGATVGRHRGPADKTPASRERERPEKGSHGASSSRLRSWLALECVNHAAVASDPPGRAGADRGPRH